MTSEEKLDYIIYLTRNLREREIMDYPAIQNTLNVNSTQFGWLLDKLETDGILTGDSFRLYIAPGGLLFEGYVNQKRRKDIEAGKLVHDSKISAWLSRTRWFPLILSLIGLLMSGYSTYSVLSMKSELKRLEIEIDMLKIELNEYHGSN